mgnify:CR=1 FL=1
MTTEQGEIIKTLFRPLLTLILVITWIVFITSAIDYPQEFKWLTLLFAGEWLTERGLKRFKELVK